MVTSRHAHLFRNSCHVLLRENVDAHRVLWRKKRNSWKAVDRQQVTPVSICDSCIENVAVGRVCRQVLVLAKTLKMLLWERYFVRSLTACCVRVGVVDMGQYHVRFLSHTVLVGQILLRKDEMQIVISSKWWESAEVRCLIVIVLYEVSEDLLGMEVVLFEWPRSCFDNLHTLVQQCLPHIQQLIFRESWRPIIDLRWISLLLQFVDLVTVSSLFAGRSGSLLALALR